MIQQIIDAAASLSNAPLPEYNYPFYPPPMDIRQRLGGLRLFT